MPRRTGRRGARLPADELVRLYDSYIESVRVYVETHWSKFPPDTLRLIALQFLEIANRAEPVPESATSGNAIGWQRMTIVTRDPEQLPAAHLVRELDKQGVDARDIVLDLMLNQIPSTRGRVRWDYRSVGRMIGRERGRLAVWEGRELDAASEGTLE